jgi:hypothetical protein
MPVALVILAFFVGGFLGSLTVALACAMARSLVESMRDDGLGIPLSTGDTSKWNLPEVGSLGRARAGWAAALGWRVWVRAKETAGSLWGAGSRCAPWLRDDSATRRRVVTWTHE